jgi:hypothetical protein
MTLSRCVGVTAQKHVAAGVAGGFAMFAHGRQTAAPAHEKRG